MEDSCEWLIDIYQVLFVHGWLEGTHDKPKGKGGKGVMVGPFLHFLVQILLTPSVNSLSLSP